MFGDVAFAQAPYAALGGSTYPVAISESATGTAESDADIRYGGLILEGATGTDSSVGRNNVYAFLYDVVTGVDNTYSNGSTLRGTMVEGAGASEVTTVVSAVMNARVNELAQITADQLAVTVKPADVAEGATGTDASSRGAGVFATQEESATGTDTQTKTAIYSVAVAETATGTDNPSSSAIIVVNPSGVQLYIVIGNPLIWGVIDDTQNPNWVPIQT